jgi:hypothetical protein
METSVVPSEPRKILGSLHALGPSLYFCLTVVAPTKPLIGCSMNHCTCPGVASVTVASSLAHNASCLACDPTMLHKSMKLSGVPNLGSLVSFTALLIFIQCFFRVPWRGYRKICLTVGGIFLAIKI